MKWSLHYLETAAPEKAPLPKDYLHTFPPKFTAEKTISGWRKVSAWQRCFSARMHGNLPAPVAAMLERKYGQFEKEAHDLRIDTDLTSSEEACAQILALLPSKSE